MLEPEVGGVVDDRASLVARKTSHRNEEIEIAVVSPFATGAGTEKRKRREPVAEAHANGMRKRAKSSKEIERLEDQRVPSRHYFFMV